MSDAPQYLPPSTVEFRHLLNSTASFDFDQISVAVESASEPYAASFARLLFLHGCGFDSSRRGDDRAMLQRPRQNRASLWLYLRETARL
jgi:hypothetical protein